MPRRTSISLITVLVVLACSDPTGTKNESAADDDRALNDRVPHADGDDDPESSSGPRSAAGAEGRSARRADAPWTGLSPALWDGGPAHPLRSRLPVGPVNVPPAAAP